MISDRPWSRACTRHGGGHAHRRRHGSASRPRAARALAQAVAARRHAPRPVRRGWARRGRRGGASGRRPACARLSPGGRPAAAGAEVPRAARPRVPARRTRGSWSPCGCCPGSRLRTALDADGCYFPGYFLLLSVLLLLMSALLFRTAGMG